MSISSHQAIREAAVACRADRLLPGLSEPFAGSVIESPRASAAFHVARAVGDPQVVKALETFEPNVPWSEGFLRIRANAYSATGNPLAAQAERDLDDFRRNIPRR